MASNVLQYKKIPALSLTAQNLLSSLQNVFVSVVNKQSELFVLNQVNRSFTNHIIWSIDNECLDKLEKCGQYIQYSASSLKCSFPVIRKLLLYPNGREECNQSFVSISIIFKDLPKSMSFECIVSLLGENGIISETETLIGDTDEFKHEINFDRFVRKSRLSKYITYNKLNIECRIKCLSKIYKCVSKKLTYQPEYCSTTNDIKGLNLNSSGMYSDLILDINYKSFKAHKFILASESSSLNILLQFNDKNILDLSDHTASIIEDLLSFIYQGKIQILSFNHICELYVTADKFGVFNLRDICSAFLSSSLTIMNVPYLLELSINYKDQQLIDTCLSFIKTNNVKSDPFMIKSLN